MYKSFFALNRNPFELSPDPSFYVSVEKEREVLASIHHGVVRRKGFVVLTGEVGTGKTLAVRYLCELWKQQHIPFANIIGPRLSVIDFLSHVIFDLGIEVKETTKGNLLRALYLFLLSQFQQGLTTVLIIDEAHQLRPHVLEEIRLLTNFETTQQKLLQVLLVGQPELDTKLDSFELRQLKQRVAIRCRLEPFSLEDTQRYIHRRLLVAGANLQSNPIFSAETVESIFRYSGGIPRLINSICEQALVAAYARQVRSVPVGIIDEVASYFRLQSTADFNRTEAFSSPSEDDKHTPRELFWQTRPTWHAAAERRRESDSTLLTNTGKSAISREAHVHPTNEQEPSAIAIRPEKQPDLSPSAATSLAPESTMTEVCGPRPTTAPTNDEPVGAEMSGTNGRLASDATRGSQQSPDTRFEFSMANTKEDSPAARKLRVTVAGAALVFVLASVGSFLFRSAVTESAGTPAHELVAPAGTTNLKEAVESHTAHSALQSSTQPKNSIAARTARETTIAVMEKKTTAGNQPQNPEPDASTRQLTPSVLEEVNAHPVAPKHISESPATPMLDGASSGEEKPLGSILSSVNSSGDLRPPEVPRNAPLQVGGRINKPRVLSQVLPAYPSAAEEAHIEGDVVVEIVVDEAGSVGDAKVISGPMVLRQAALEALRRWKYEPSTLDGRPISVQMLVTIQFRR